MIQLTPQMRLVVAVVPVDFRRGIDGLARVCRELLSADPLSGTVFAFRNRRATAIKLLTYDGQGFWLCQKRLSQGRFRYWREPERGEARAARARAGRAARGRRSRSDRRRAAVASCHAERRDVIAFFLRSVRACGSTRPRGHGAAVSRARDR